MKPQPMYLSPSIHLPNHASDCFGWIISPRSVGPRFFEYSRWWAGDNDCFNGGLDEPKWLAMLEKGHPYRHRCLFITMPDVVGDAAATLNPFEHYAPMVRAMGYPVALVTQDGLTPGMVVWSEVDALFIGGTDQHKLGPEAGALIDAAKARGKWVHVGRVNSYRRLLQFWRADSWDGTDVTRKPSRYAMYERAVRQVRAMQNQQHSFLEHVA